MFVSLPVHYDVCRMIYNSSRTLRDDAVVSHWKNKIINNPLPIIGLKKAKLFSIHQSQYFRLIFFLSTNSSDKAFFLIYEQLCACNTPTILIAYIV
jgi:hypothetical protein